MASATDPAVSFVAGSAAVVPLVCGTGSGVLVCTAGGARGGFEVCAATVRRPRPVLLWGSGVGDGTAGGCGAVGLAVVA